jgi:hypothetical protein
MRIFSVSCGDPTICAELKVRANLIDNTSTWCSSVQETFRIFHFISDIILNHNNHWWKDEDDALPIILLLYFFAGMPACLDDKYCILTFFLSCSSTFIPLLFPFVRNLCYAIVLFFTRLYTIYKWATSNQLIPVFLASTSKWLIQQTSWSFSLIEHRTYCLPLFQTIRPPLILSQIEILDVCMIKYSSLRFFIQNHIYLIPLERHLSKHVEVWNQQNL